jgi:hypothetical protein
VRRFRLPPAEPPDGLYRAVPKGFACIEEDPETALDAGQTGAGELGQEISKLLHISAII